MRFIFATAMKPRNVVFTLVIILILFAMGINAVRHQYKAKEAFDRHPDRLQFTEVALCRMNCRQITKDDVYDIIEKGIINFSKSERNSRPCPTYAMQGNTDGGESLRVIITQCANETKVINCYRLKKQVECHCPGDSSYQ
jgi:hypothetical protein